MISAKRLVKTLDVLLAKRRGGPRFRGGRSYKTNIHRNLLSLIYSLSRPSATAPPKEEPLGENVRLVYRRAVAAGDCFRAVIALSYHKICHKNIFRIIFLYTKRRFLVYSDKKMSYNRVVI